MELKKSIRLSMFLAIMIVLSLLESLIPISFIPGFKIGLCNIIILIILYIYSYKDAMYVSILRIFIISVFRTGLFSTYFFFSLGGTILSIIMMNIFKKTKLSMIGVSIVGSIFHGIGQILVGIIILHNIHLLYYLPYLIILSIITGMIIGIISKNILSNMKKEKII